jgi:tRNA A-37 threonylcarbamoyl transferase component Bud32
VDVDTFTRPYILTRGEGLRQVLASLGFSLHGYVLYLTFFEVVQVAGFALVGLIVFRYRSDDWFALLVSGMLVAFGVGSVAHVPPPLDALARAIYSLGLVLLYLCMYLFPDGRFVPRWTRVLAVLVVLWRALYLFPEPWHPPSWPAPTSLLLDTALFATGVYAQIYRYLRVSSPVQRQQTKWVVWGLAIASVAVYGYIVYGYVVRFSVVPWLMESDRYLYLHLVFWQPFRTVALLLAPVSIAMSILRRRLWEIDFVINRTLVYGTLTVLLVVSIAVGLLAVSLLSQTYVGEQHYGYAVVVAALVFGAIFLPLRLRLQRAVDRYLYGIQIDYQGASPAGRGPRTPSAALRIDAYTDLELVGRGGMAEVYKAQDVRSGHLVAIKALHPHLVRDADLCRRLEREARAARRLTHPNIVKVYGCGQSGSRVYVVMQYVAGPNLGQFLVRQGRLPLVQARRIIRDVAAALDYAHQQAVIHRDVKSSNVMLDPVGTAGARGIAYRGMITDFGLARIVDESTRLTHSGVVGTFSYVAPEQIQSPENVDGRADVYGLGVVAYQMLTGELPFKQRNPGALLIAHLTQPPPDRCDLVPDLPPRVGCAVQRALSKSPKDRYPTAGQLAQALG